MAGSPGDVGVELGDLVQPGGMGELGDGITEAPGTWFGDQMGTIWQRQGHVAKGTVM